MTVRRICNTDPYRFIPQTAETMGSLSLSCSNLGSAPNEKNPFNVCILTASSQLCVMEFRCLLKVVCSKLLLSHKKY